MQIDKIGLFYKGLDNYSQKYLHISLLGGIFWSTLIKRFSSMLIEEEETKPVGDLNPDALEEVFESDIIVDEEVVIFSKEEDEEADEIDIAFAANDEGYW